VELVTCFNRTHLHLFAKITVEIPPAQAVHLIDGELYEVNQWGLYINQKRNKVYKKKGKSWNIRCNVYQLGLLYS